MTIFLTAVIFGAETWNEIEEFGGAMEDWFADVLELPNGIPSHDSLNRVFSALDPKQFQGCFHGWIRAVAGVLPAQVIAMYGNEVVQRSYDRWAGKGPIHTVRVWATENRLVLVQVMEYEKSNEITALPELLRSLSIFGCIVTIDSMGCQRQIAKQIVDQTRDYVLALKGNRGALQQDGEDSLCSSIRSRVLLTFDDQAARMILRQSRSSKARPYIWLFRNLTRLTVPYPLLSPTSSSNESKSQNLSLGSRPS